MRKKVIYTERALDSVEAYIMQYRAYFHEIYSDTGIWSEEEILKSYVLEMQNRKGEMFKLMQERFSADEVLWRTSDASAILPWRSKYLFIAWETVDNNTRVITSIQIR